MLRNTLIGGVAAAAIAISGAAFAQGASSSPSSNASPNATGTAPGLQNNRNEVPHATPGSQRAQERTGASGSTTSQTSPTTRGSTAVTGKSERSGSADNLTTGNIPKIQVSEQQRTKLRTSFRQANIRTVDRGQINVAIAVGAVLPSTVTFVPIPDPVLAVVPAFRGYRAVRVGDQILIVEPGTRRIVYIVEA